jgi:hypothetical protein
LKRNRYEKGSLHEKNHEIARLGAKCFRLYRKHLINEKNAVIIDEDNHFQKRKDGGWKMSDNPEGSDRKRGGEMPFSSPVLLPQKRGNSFGRSTYRRTDAPDFANAQGQKL